MTAADKYREAIELYTSTRLSITEISRRCNVTRDGLAGYIRRCHRDLMQARHGLSGNPDLPIRHNKGQRPETEAKYHEAIAACKSEEFINLNISQIAAKYHLNATALANQLRAHYPEILQHRDEERHRRGLTGRARQGANKSVSETYAQAVDMLRDTNMTIEEVADRCGVSFTGLRQHLLFYHKDLAEERDRRRRQGKLQPRIGTVSGNGTIRTAPQSAVTKYATAVEMYRTTSFTISEIAKRTGVSAAGLRNHLMTWHRRLVFERRGAKYPADATSDRESLTGIRRYHASTREKYAKAIKELKSTDVTVEGVARRFGFIPEVLRAYLKEHEPALYESLGMMTLPNGRTVLRRSYEKYAEAINIFATTDEPLKSIAARCGVTYNSLGGFIRRNLPELLSRRRPTK